MTEHPVAPAASPKAATVASAPEHPTTAAAPGTPDAGDAATVGDQRVQPLRVDLAEPARQDVAVWKDTAIRAVAGTAVGAGRGASADGGTLYGLNENKKRDAAYREACASRIRRHDDGA